MQARTTVLHLDEEKSLELAKDLTLEKVAEMVRSQGALQGVMTCTMLSMSAHLTKELGMAPGGEFRRAYREAKEVPGCLVHLGDRPIQITLKRAFGRYAQYFTELALLFQLQHTVCLFGTLLVFDPIPYMVKVRHDV